ncbi:MAG: amidase [Acidobacteria bacterium]|nr:amidase [Acidobacteriota bacterium]
MSRRSVLMAGGFSAVAAVRGELHWLSMAEAARMVRARKVSPLELTEAALKRVEQHRGLNAFITVMAEEALRTARELTGARVRGPLHGIPIAVKDLYDTAGVRTTAASAHFAERVPTVDAEVVARLKAAGAVLLGKLNMDEFAYNFTSETSAYGVAHNPWKHGFTPGGSSGGSGVAVAAGLCYGALGSDTGGSIRLPAALCGVVGFKPTYGALPARGVLPLSWSLDHVGPMCRTVEDTRLMLGAMGMPVGAASVKGLRVGVPRALYWEKLHPEVAALVEKAAGVLGGVREVTIPALRMMEQIPVLPADYGTVITVEAFAYHEERAAKAPEKFHKGTLTSIRNGVGAPAPAYARAVRAMLEAREQNRALLFRDADLLAMPAAPGPAFALGSTADLIYLRNLAPWNFYGLPAVSLPCGFTGDGLPVGLQLVGPAGADAVVLAAAEVVEKALGVSGRHAPL